jgi:hypothetical protein
MRAAAFIRYRSGEGFGHVGWAFDFDPPHANAGSVENHTGRWFSTASEMGFWSEFSSDPVELMRRRQYDDVKYLDLPNSDPVLAYRTVLWIRKNGYRAWLRNCEDDVYDVLRAFGVQNLTPPSLCWFPKSWFRRFRGTLAPVAHFGWTHVKPSSSAPLPDPGDTLTPWQPTWRRPWHIDFHTLKFWRLMRHRPSN